MDIFVNRSLHVGDRVNNAGVPQDRSLPPKRSHQQAVKWTIFLGATAVVVSLCLLMLRPFLDVLAWSAVLTIAFHPVHRYLVDKTGRVALSALLASVLVVTVILIPLLFITGLAVSQFLALKDYLQQTFRNGFDLDHIGPLRGMYEWLVHRTGLDATGMLGWLSEHAGDVGGAMAGLSFAILSSLSAGLISSVFTVFAMFLLFRDGDRIVGTILSLLPFERELSETMLMRIRDVIYASVYGVLVIGVIQGVLCGLMFWFLGIPSAALWGGVTALTGVLPLVGAAVVWAPGTVYLLAIGHWGQAIVLAVWGAAVVSTVDNFLRPKLVGDRAGLSELVTFFALLGGLQVFGVLGIVMGPVLFAVAASILDVLSSETPTPAE